MASQEFQTVGQETNRGLRHNEGESGAGSGSRPPKLGGQHGRSPCEGRFAESLRNKRIGSPLSRDFDFVSITLSP
jgi:hypothetical protein